MSAAQYNRGSRQISQQIAREARAAGFDLMDDLNSLPKDPDALKPFGPVMFKRDPHHKGWWALDPVKQWRGFGYYFPSLRAAVTAFRVDIVSHDESELTFTGEPA